MLFSTLFKASRSVGAVPGAGRGLPLWVGARRGPGPAPPARLRGRAGGCRAAARGEARPPPVGAVGPPKPATRWRSSAAASGPPFANPCHLSVRPLFVTVTPSSRSPRGGVRASQTRVKEKGARRARACRRPCRERPARGAEGARPGRRRHVPGSRLHPWAPSTRVRPPRTSGPKSGVQHRARRAAGAAKGRAGGCEPGPRRARPAQTGKTRAEPAAFPSAGQVSPSTSSLC